MLIEPVLPEEMAAEGLTRWEADPSYWLSADGSPYEYEVQAPDFEIDVEQLQLLTRAGGAVMRCSIVLHILVSDLSGRPALARITERVAPRAEGWVFVEFSSSLSTELLKY